MGRTPRLGFHSVVSSLSTKLNLFGAGGDVGGGGGGGGGLECLRHIQTSQRMNR